MSADKETGAAAGAVLLGTLQTAGAHRFGRITLNAPASLNALSLAMVEAIDAQLEAWTGDAGIAGVVIDATGEKAFCAGGDIVGLYQSIRSTPRGEVPREAAHFFAREYRLDYRIHRYPKPVLCWGTGIVMGGGIGLLAGASHRVVTPTSRLAMPETGIGLYPDVGGSAILARMPQRLGLYLGLTGASLNAADALFVGLATHAVDAGQRGALLEAIARSAWSGDADADRQRLDALLADLGQGLALPDSPLREHAHRIAASIGSGDDLPAIVSRLRALQEDADPWLAKAGKAVAAASPTSLALAFAMQQRARDLPLADVFRLEWLASVGCCLHHDFPEGVRALLIDKDKQPRWNPATLDAVTARHLEDHLAPPRDGAHPLADLA
ncbi:enoyl-CoA hydratase/isomerase family protein [Cupriavidus sp. AU9028]|uniref:enoyl-CoA hydratase/isomerase family protein n=1 Tax=Cupriavidus sp. AU9028 TaxID=2871157 RepID=UPI001C96CA6E|nr:enoyl-CoA hydratase/isomerase family protein [Cupriavidus sp. AU9028]MBY4895579.1 enoyl-CoA hydratase/isomerase family protein [Cupriavidus sp. AU9028]